MVAGTKALHNVLLQVQKMKGMDQIFSSTVSTTAMSYQAGWMIAGGQFHDDVACGFIESSTPRLNAERWFSPSKMRGLVLQRTIAVFGFNRTPYFA